jgi:small subunit ribosomal protein S4
MARYTGPKTKISRRFGVMISGSVKAFERRTFAPGQHGAKNARKKRTDYHAALTEKQKLRAQYGVLERQFRRVFARALAARGITGELLLQSLECRLDNVVYRLGLGPTREAARQAIAHGHITVNGRKVNVPSYEVRAGDKIGVRNNPRSRQLALRSFDLTQIRQVPDWLVVDKENLSGSVARVPSRDDIQPIVNEQVVVELYSR